MWNAYMLRTVTATVNLRVVLKLFNAKLAFLLPFPAHITLHGAYNTGIETP